MVPKGRANTLFKKVKVIVTLMYVWSKNPQLRLGQLLVNMGIDDNNLFYMEDERFAQIAKLYLLRYSKR